MARSKARFLKKRKKNFCALAELLRHVEVVGKIGRLPYVISVNADGAIYSRWSVCMPVDN
jgi:hypothetical protein